MRVRALQSQGLLLRTGIRIEYTNKFHYAKSTGVIPVVILFIGSHTSC